ncbi:unnamed protein product [Alternaria alternata]
MPTRFEVRKQKILEQLDAPDGEYHDLSPKGSIDAPIRDLIGEINKLQGLVTTSSCSGRISVFLEGRKADAEVSDSAQGEESRAGPGGKGGGGAWLFISHTPVERVEANHDLMSEFGLQKYETEERTPRFRESGAVSLGSPNTGDSNPMVAVRSAGYSFDSIIGYQDDDGSNVALVDQQYLRTLIKIANERFKINFDRISRFRQALLQTYEPKLLNGTKADWEDADVRKRRKREEGLARQQALQNQNSGGNVDVSEEADVGNMIEMFS